MVEVSGTSLVCCPTKHHSRWWFHRAARAGSLKSRIWKHLQRARSYLFSPVWWVWPFCSAVFQSSPPVRTREQSSQVFFTETSPLSHGGELGVFPPGGGWPDFRKTPRHDNPQKCMAVLLWVLVNNPLSTLETAPSSRYKYGYCEGFIPRVSPLDTCCLLSGTREPPRAERCWQWALFLHSWHSS